MIMMIMNSFDPIIIIMIICVISVQKQRPCPQAGLRRRGCILRTGRHLVVTLKCKITLAKLNLSAKLRLSASAVIFLKRV